MRDNTIYLYCTRCGWFVEREGGQLSCNCASRRIPEDEHNPYPDTWIDSRPHEPYDTLEEKWL